MGIAPAQCMRACACVCVRVRACIFSTRRALGTIALHSEHACLEVIQQRIIVACPQIIADRRASTLAR